MRYYRFTATLGCRFDVEAESEDEAHRIMEGMFDDADGLTVNVEERDDNGVVDEQKGTVVKVSDLEFDKVLSE